MGAAHVRAIIFEGGKVIIGDVLDAEGGCAWLRNPASVTPSTRIWTLLTFSARLDRGDCFGRLHLWRAERAGRSERLAFMNSGTLDVYRADDWNKIMGSPDRSVPRCQSRTLAIDPIRSGIDHQCLLDCGIRRDFALHGYTASKFGVRGLTG